jgi:hypothetical protein
VYEDWRHGRSAIYLAILQCIKCSCSACLKDADLKTVLPLTQYLTANENICFVLWNFQFIGYVAGKAALTRGKRPPTAWRRLAVKCYHSSEDNMANAVKAFKAQIKGKCMGRPEKYIARWAAAFQNKGTVEDGGHKGRQRKLDDAQAKAAAETFCQGYKQKGSSITLHYLSIREGISKSTKLQQIQQETGACDRTILRSMKRVLPTLCMRTERFSQSLSTTAIRPLNLSDIGV